ncbi:MAG: UvrD-helicase domain-containing protein [Clostridiales bacterium]|nr:UvrD-helicase domain-containing protein [Clostridiales bacterium]
MHWTKAQKKVIDSRNKNLLVSAAAGSGKTAVLVERIITMISEGDNPLDIDGLLVVTFTSAAAAQMKDRIGKALDKKLINEPNNAHLRKQASLLQSAHITTIHSFCLNVIRNYFHLIDLDPAFKIAEESEITLMKSDIISDLLERWYEEGDDNFHLLIESYSRSKSDAPVEELVLSLYNFAMSNPWPKAWLKKIQGTFNFHTLEDMYKAQWMEELLNYVGVVLRDLEEKNKEAIDICNETDGPSAYITALLSDRELINELMKKTSYEGFAEAFSKISYARLSSKRQEVSQEKKDKVKALRDEVKKGIKDLNTQFFFQSPEEMLNDLMSVSKVMEVLSELTLEFIEAYRTKKEEKNLLDFNDLEHFALKILIEDNDGEIVPTKAATELSQQFVEILIDEYQDSNLVQETILKSISREGKGQYNRFMVGDVKQSIYKLRLAMPEIFIDKYKRYETYNQNHEGKINLTQRIDLDKNFRSRKVVLDFVNAIFEQIMTEPIGGVIYDDAASLKYGELYEELMKSSSIEESKGSEQSDNIEPNDEIEQIIKLEQNNEIEGNNESKQNNEVAQYYSNAMENIKDRISKDVELILVTEEELDGDINSDIGRYNGFVEDEDDIQYSKKELEARVVARRIKELIDPDKGLMLFDRDNLSHRPAELKDMVILLRTMSGWSEVFVNTLMQEGIPAYADTGTGYFQTVEIMTILNMLRIIDNPRQDIPFAGVLYSPMVGLSSDELACIRLIDKKSTMYAASLAYAKEGSREELKNKLMLFLNQLHRLREMVKYTPIHELIQKVLEMTGYRYYVMAMPGGERRKANIDMLISHAVRFEKGSYSGLFHFIRYIEKLHKYEVDFGEASTSGEQENAVRIMSIHKSKGLEFPIVFVGGLSKQFNMQDQRQSIVFDVDYGVGPDYIDVENRTKVPTLLKKVIQKKTQIDALGEEIRVLYVAMTRAKEKLIMTGYLKSLDDLYIQKDFSFFELMSVKSYLDLVLPAMNNRIDDNMKIKVIGKQDLVSTEMAKQVFLSQDFADIRKCINSGMRDENLQKEIRERLSFTYPYSDEARLRVKLSVSELKKMGQFIDDEDSVILYEKQVDGLISDNRVSEETYGDLSFEEATFPDKEKGHLLPSDNQYVPKFIKGSQADITGTDRGTLYHKVLELLMPSKVNDTKDLIAQLDDMVQLGHISKEDIARLNLNNIYAFTQSQVARRIYKAWKDGKLNKEKQFVIGLPARDIYPDNNSQELILIQGIIDVFFEEEGELVLLDYKSDIVQHEDQLIDRYKVQLIYYKKALEQILGKRVKEMIIYSLYLGKEIVVCK